MYGPSESAQHDQQAAYVRCSRGLRAAWRDQQGLAAAEKALLALVALAMILMVGRIILNGSRVASDRSVAMLTESSGAPAISWNDSGSPSGGTTLGGGSSGSKGGGFLDGIGGALSDSWGAVKEAGRQVGGFVYGVGTGAVEMVKGTAELVWSVGKMTVGELIDPDAAQAERDKWGQVISVVVEDPGKLWDAITEPIVESWNRGDYGEAIGRGVFEAASTVVGPKGLNKIGTIGKVSSKADDVARIGNALDDVAKTGSKLDDAGRVGNKLDEAADASRISSTGPRKVCEGPSCLCFSSDTPVMTASGPQPISELRPGDLVLSKDEQTGETALRSVVQVFVTPKRPLMALTIQTDSGQTETLRLTDSHPMYAKGKGFVAARELLSGDELVNSAGARLIVVGSESLSERHTVYNLEVEGFHTYFAGRLEAWAHNMCSVGYNGSVDTPNRIPHGLNPIQFEQAGQSLRQGLSHLGDDVIVQGSRVTGTAHAASDIDFAVRLSDADFAAFVRARFGTPNPGSAAERTMQMAIQNGRVHAGEAGLRSLRTKLQELLGMDVDVAVIRRGGPFDQGPHIPVPNGN